MPRRTMIDELNERRAAEGLPPLPPPKPRRPQKNPRGLKIVPPVDAHHDQVDANAPTQPAPETPRRPPSPQVDAHQSPNVDAHKTDRHDRNKVRQHFRLSPDIHKHFSVFRAQTGLELQEFFELAGVHFIECVGVHIAEGVGALASHDDGDKMIMYKTNPLIINLYLQYNPLNRWKPADDRAACAYNDVDLRLIENAFITTQFNARFKRIHSFEYYRTEIEVAMEIPLASETLNAMLKSNRRRWEQARPES